MTPFVFLTILPRRIEPAAWARTYDDVQRLWSHDPGEALMPPDMERASVRPQQSGLLSLHQRPGATGPRRVYLREIEHLGERTEQREPLPRHLQVCGDARGRLVGERFRLYCDLAVYRQRVLTPGLGPRDILLPDPSNSAEVAVFSGDTGGHPYHRSVLAAAMLIESRFPGAALCSGDLDAGQAQEAAALLQSVLGLTVALPVTVDPEALWARMSAQLSGEDLWRAVLARHRGDPGDAHEVLLRLVGASAGYCWLRSELRVCRSPGQHAAGMRMVEWLNATNDLESLFRAACVDPLGPRFAPELTVSAVVSTFVTCAPSARSGLQSLSPLTPHASPQSGMTGLIDLQLAEVLLDLQQTGRRTRAYLSLAQAEDALHSCFDHGAGAGVMVEDLVRRLRAETARRIQLLTDLLGPVLRSVEAMRARMAELDPALLLRCQRVHDLPMRAQRAVVAYSFTVQGLLNKLQGEEELGVLFEGPPAMLRARAVALLEQRGEALTAEAWKEIEGTARWLARTSGPQNDNAGVVGMEQGQGLLEDREDEMSLRFLVALIVAGMPATERDLSVSPRVVAPGTVGPAAADWLDEREDLSGEDGDAAVEADAPRGGYRRALLENGLLRRDLARLLRDPEAGGVIAGVVEEMRSVPNAGPLC